MWVRLHVRISLARGCRISEGESMRMHARIMQGIDHQPDSGPEEQTSEASVWLLSAHPGQVIGLDPVNCSNRLCNAHRVHDGG